MLKAFGDIGGAYKFSIFTGDVVEAAVWLVTEDEVTSDMQMFNNDMASKLGAPVFPAIGNHEAAPVNAFPRTTTDTSMGVQYVFDTQSSGWAQWIGSVSAAQVTHYSGSYSAVVSGTNLRIISINTVYWYKQNYWLYDSDDFQPDPNGILAFTVQQLQAAEDAGQRAWIIGHMPPGVHDALLDQSNYFDQIIQRYKNTIAGTFYGHTHIDQFEIGYSDYTQQTAANAVSFAWIAPALTPRSGNPAFKIYDIDPDTYEVMDSRVYTTDVTQSTLTWKLYYSARQTYGPLVGPLAATDSLNPAFWHKVTDAFVSNDAAFQTYINLQNRGFSTTTCTGTCKTTTICDLRTMRSQNNCDVSSASVPSKRDTNTTVLRQHLDCEGAGLGHIFTKMAEKVSSGVSPAEMARLRGRVQKIIPNH
jgi:sphingomyelin phosphodiesterase